MSSADWAKMQGKRISEKTRLMYCQHFDGAHCDACAPLVIARALRCAEKRGYQRGVKELAKVLTGRRRQERER